MIFHLLIAPSVIISIIMINKTFGFVLLIAHCTIAFINIFEIRLMDSTLVVGSILWIKRPRISGSSITKSSAQIPDTSSTSIGLDLCAGVATDAKH
jgi:hypothetical protein